MASLPFDVTSFYTLAEGEPACTISHFGQVAKQ
jgi:hypothetical protein